MSAERARQSRDLVIPFERLTCSSHAVEVRDHLGAASRVHFCGRVTSSSATSAVGGGAAVVQRPSTWAFGRC